MIWGDNDNDDETSAVRLSQQWSQKHNDRIVRNQQSKQSMNESEGDESKVRSE